MGLDDLERIKNVQAPPPAPNARKPLPKKAWVTIWIFISIGLIAILGTIGFAAYQLWQVKSTMDDLRSGNGNDSKNSSRVIHARRSVG